MKDLVLIRGKDTQAFAKQAYSLFTSNRQAPWSFNTFQNSLHTDLSALVCLNSTVVGFIIVSSVLGHAEIEDVCTDISHRNRGIASYLLEQMIGCAQKSGISEIFLEVAESNQSAFSLYQKTGFKVKGKRKAYYSSLSKNEGQAEHNIDALLMQKTLS